MSNMSYCRFENTSRDMADCLSYIEHGEMEVADLNEYERRGLADMVMYARQLVEVADSGRFVGLNATTVPTTPTPGPWKYRGD